MVHGSSKPAAKRKRAAAADDLPSQLWKVKNFVRKRRTSGGVEYLVEWEGWDGEPTWEPADNVYEVCRPCTHTTACIQL